MLTIDCSKLIESRSEAAFIKEIAAQVGYRPVFSWINNLSSLIDLIVQGVIGQKAGFSESVDTQFRNILESAARAIEDIAEASHKYDSKVLDETEFIEVRNFSR